MIDWSTTALVFPGQGSQQVGMGADLATQFPTAKEVFDQADQAFGYAFSKILFEGPAEALDSTENTQPALYIAGVATLRAIESVLGTFKPVAVAGHSVGELTALTAAGALPFEDGLRLVRERGRLMKLSGEESPGGMAALLGAELADTEAICAQASAESGHSVTVANDNCPGQIVISGENAAIDQAMKVAEARGIKRVVRLAVSIAAHSSLMTSATADFRKAFATTNFAAPTVPIIGNVNAAALNTADDIRAELSDQLVNRVRWRESILALRAQGVHTFLELGPKDVLTGLLKRIDRAATGVAVNSAAAVTALANR